MLTETSELVEITVMSLGEIRTKVVTTILRDGVEVSKLAPHYVVYPPGSDISEAPAPTQDIADVIWTPEVITKYQEEQAKITEQRAAMAQPKV